MAIVRFIIIFSIFCIMVFPCSEGNAQVNLIGLNGSFNKSNVYSPSLFENSGNIENLDIGITFEKLFTEFFSIGADVIIDHRGFTSYLPGERYGDFNSKYYYRYLSFPLKIGYYKPLNNNVLGFIKTGLVTSLLTSAIVELPKFDINQNIIGKENINTTNQASNLDFGGLAEAGGAYLFSENLWMTISLIYQHSLTSIANAEYFTNETIRHYSIGINLGIKWVFTNNGKNLN